jgi:RimJ/RimL family protein N-acetyltransferase
MSEFKLVLADPTRVAEFVKQFVPLNLSPGFTAIGQEHNGELTAGVIYDGFNGRNVWMHVGANPGRRSMTRSFIRSIFLYPFQQLGCAYARGAIDASNLDCRKFAEKLGFKFDARLVGAAADGGDVILYVMARDECRHIRA